MKITEFEEGHYYKRPLWNVVVYCRPNTQELMFISNLDLYDTYSPSNFNLNDIKADDFFEVEL